MASFMHNHDTCSYMYIGPPGLWESLHVHKFAWLMIYYDINQTMNHSGSFVYIHDDNFYSYIH